MIQWKQYQIELFKQQTGLQLVQDPQTIRSGNKDFGGLHEGQAFAIFTPLNLEEAQTFLNFSFKNNLPVTIRCQGLSQSGQSLARPGQVLVDVRSLNHELQIRSTSVHAGCAVSWADIIRCALQKSRIPPVFPYNTRLSLGGVLSVGGLGSASPQQGTCVAHVDSLQVLKIDGTLVYCDRQSNSELMDAVLAGLGQFGIIYSAELRTRPVADSVSTQHLFFEDAQQWLKEQFRWRDKVEYMEANCLFVDPVDFSPLDKPLFRISLGSERSVLVENSRQGKEGIQQLGIEEYVFRHETRISAMMSEPYIHYYHPWFECYADRELITKNIEVLVNTYPRSLGPMIHCFPVARRHSRLFELPAGKDIMTFNILTPGVAPEHLEECQQWLKSVDNLLRANGGKRYISSWIEESWNPAYWQGHYGADWQYWQYLKKRFDPGEQLGPRDSSLSEDTMWDAP